MKEQFYKDIQVEIKKRHPELNIQIEEKKMILTDFCIEGFRLEDNNGKLIIRCNKITLLNPNNVAEYIYTHLDTENVSIRYKSDACLYLYPSQNFDQTAEGMFDRRMWMLRIIDALQALLTALNLTPKSSKYVNSSRL